ncbi:flagellar biosynthetic protein FliR [Salidesulfovibrio onnuriiensis]|uniref:flagellar biosynthetic protein FliR n=1 Tax=Salidesulfovibrio onnuriiensis TaxID=2583823 RepID=UPI0011C9CB08|nr:flagellar biosynthetic protein FliR [Salidesulfovibrio onnuriiensis]
MDIFNFDPGNILSFYLTLFRVSIVLFLLPFYGGRSIPTKIKAVLTLALSLALWPHLSFPAEMFPQNPWEILIMLLGEAALGLTLGLMVRILFSAVQTGGHIIGFQMGFAMVNVVDPLTGVSEAVSAHFLYMCTMLTFLTLNGHLYLLQALSQSFEFVPPGQFMINSVIAAQVFTFSKQLFILAIKIAAPVMAAVFLVDLALALIAKAAPQMHVLVVGFPVKIAVGFLFLGSLFEILAVYVTDFIKGLGPLFLHMLKAMGAQ